VSQHSLSPICPSRVSFLGKAEGHKKPTRIERGNYTADVLHHTSAESLWYYVIQRKDSNEVIDLVKFNTYEQAIARVREVLATLNAKC
jgi:hypothetical protein